MLTTLILNILTAKVVPVVFPPIIAALRKYALAKLPPALIPLALTIGGAFVTSTAAVVGADVGGVDLATAGSAAWDGALLGLATTGVHQLWKHGVEWFRSLKRDE